MGQSHGKAKIIKYTKICNLVEQKLSELIFHIYCIIILK